MEHLYQRSLYGEELAIRIEAMGATAVAIANRWTLGWLASVTEMLAQDNYLERLENQTNFEKDIYSESTCCAHLSSHELRAIHGVCDAP